MPDSNPANPWQQPGAMRQFLENVHGAIPVSIEQIDMMMRLLAAACEQIRSFLDLGSGDTVLAAAILDEHRDARGILVDVSDSRLEAKRQQLEPYRERLTFLAADFLHPDWMNTLPAGQQFDGIISAFAIHAAADQRKRALYAELFNLLRPEGIFINIEHVASATRWTESVWDDYMIDAIFGAHLKGAPGKSRADVAREYYERAAKEANAVAPLEVQCDWLRAIGYENVDCYLKVLELAMFGGQKPPAE